MSVIRIWGGHREWDWNSYWRTSELLQVQPRLAEALDNYGIAEVDICPATPARVPTTLHYFEIFVPNATSSSDADLVCAEIQELTGRLAQPLATQTDEAFKAQAGARLLYLR